MKKSTLILLLLIPVSLFAQMHVKRNYDPKYSVMCIIGNDTVAEYRDSLVSFKISMNHSLDCFGLYLKNETDHRIAIEWENVTINHSKIAFGEEFVFELNKSRTDEVVKAHDFVLQEEIFKRYGFEIVDKRKLKKKGAQTISFSIPIKVDEKVYDISTTWVVRKIKK